jgi:subtilase family serine protease
LQAEARVQAINQQQLPVLVPESAGIAARDLGVRVHTALRVLVVPDAASNSTSSVINTPSMIRQYYMLPATGGSNAIAIVDAYDYPTALNDFNAFAQYFSLPKETSTNPTGNNSRFQVVYASGTKPQSGGSYISSWNMEEALDIEWAHAMAPQAKIYLVEAASDSTNDLTAAVRVASALPGVKEVSMSWGGSEFSTEASYDSTFTTPGVVYLASGGDSGAVMEYPAASPNVVSCGGTTVNRNGGGTVTSEAGWADTGCGYSVYEPRPSFQNGVSSVVGNHRGVCDMSFDADPNTGVYVYDSTPLWGETGWWVLGGTSVSAPCLTGLVNVAGTINGFAQNTAAEQARIYSNLGNSAAFHDITTGTAGQFSCSVGYDFLTGIGSPRGLVGK